MENGATIDALTCIGQDVQAVADRTIVEYLIDLKKVGLVQIIHFMVCFYTV